MTSSRKKTLRWLLPLWMATALLLTAGWYAGAQTDTTAVPQTDTVTAAAGAALPGSDTVAGTEAAARQAQTPQSGVAEDSARPGPVTGDMTAAQRARLAREEAQGGTLAERAVSLLGLVVFVLLAWAMSVHRKAVSWRIVAWGLGLQFIFGVLVLKTGPGRAFFDWLNGIFTALLGYTNEGAKFVFGNLITPNVPVGPAGGPFAPITDPSGWANTGALFAFSVLPTIIFFSALMTILYYLGFMQAVVRGFAWVMMKTMRISGAESLSASGNIFLGQTEAPLLVKPFVKKMTLSELHCVMTGGFATVAGGVLAAYVGMLSGYFPSIAGHLIAASVLSAPAAIVCSKLMFPETEEPETRGDTRIELEKVDANVIDAAARGASEGLGLALNVGAMLIAFIALLALLNGLLMWATGFFGNPISIQTILGWIGAPLAWLMGTPWKDALVVGTLIGEKTALNEFVAYAHLAEILQSGEQLSARSIVIATYALCGFANFSSIAIQIGGIGGLAPERRGDLSRLGLRAMIAGTLASFMTACIVGILM